MKDISIFTRIHLELLFMLPHRIAHQLIYYRTHKSFINWNNPLTYDEKIHWIIANRLDASYSKYADKYLVREYVKNCGFEDMLIPLQGVWDNADDIDFDKLSYPNIFKVNNGSGTKCYHFMHSKEDADMTRKKMREAMKIDISKYACEYQYHYIKPKILCEKLIGEENQRLTDYKIVCSNGKPKAILVCQDRNKGRDYYTLDWKHTEYTKKERQSGFLIPKPQGLEKMLEAASTLSKPFEFARVDFYEVNGKVYFGEITLSPSSGNHANLTKEGQKVLGSYIELNR